MGIDPDMEPVLDELRADYERADASFAQADQELAARIAVLEGRPAGEGGALPADALDALKAVQDSIAAHTTRIAALESGQVNRDGIIAALKDDLRAWIDGGAPSKPTDPAPVDPIPSIDLPAGYRMVQDFRFDRGLTYNWNSTEIDFYLPNWVGGDQTIGGSWGEPRLLTYNADKTVTVNAGYESGKWRNGAFQSASRINKPIGKWGAIVSAADANAVHAFFIHASNSKELDFELVRRNGKIGWAPAVHMPKEGGGTGHSNKRVLSLGEFTPGVPQQLEFELFADRCEFSIDGVLFETVTPADMSTGTIWDTTKNASVFCSIERHGGWAGWTDADYAKGSRMNVHALLM